MIAFQIIEAPFNVFGWLLIQASRETGVMYFCRITLVQRLVVLISCHPPFAASALEKRKIFFSPQPPKAFGVAIFSQWTQGITCDFDLPLQRNFEVSFLATFRISLGIQERDIQ